VIGEAVAIPVVGKLLHGREIVLVIPAFVGIWHSVLVEEIPVVVEG